METSDAILKALTLAVSGERKTIPTWGGNPTTLRSWLRQLAYWEVDNSVQPQRWGIKLFQALNEGSPPRKIAEGIPMETILSPTGYAAILSAVMEKYAPYIEASAPAAIDAFFFSGERQRSETFTNDIASKEILRQEAESLSGERIPEKIAGRILMKHASLSETQRENLAVKHQALVDWNQVAAALRPLDRPEALIKTAAGTSNQTANQTYWTTEGEEFYEDKAHNEEYGGEWDEVCDETLYEEHGGEDDGDDNVMFFEADREYTEEEATQGRGGEVINNAFMVAEARPLSIYAGIRTLANEGLVDSRRTR
eukprot:s243_g5.t1